MANEAGEEAMTGAIICLQGEFGTCTRQLRSDLWPRAAAAFMYLTAKRLVQRQSSAPK